MLIDIDGSINIVNIVDNDQHRQRGPASHSRNVSAGRSLSTSCRRTPWPQLADQRGAACDSRRVSATGSLSASAAIALVGLARGLRRRAFPQRLGLNSLISLAAPVTRAACQRLGVIALVSAARAAIRAVGR
ncbi:MAG TPA: hypothetical protein VGN81_00945 [Pseudonocardiaceae bacterium]|jgi:hypothetical protein